MHAPAFGASRSRRTQFEAFLSLRKVSVNGLDVATEQERRCVIVPIHNAPPIMAQALVDEWGRKTATQAHGVLKQPDVKVTNQSDKEVQLPKLLALDDFAKREALQRL